MHTATGRIAISEKARKIIGIPKGIGIKNLRDFVNVLQPADAISFYEIEDRIHNNKLPFKKEFRITNQSKGARIIKLNIESVELGGRIDIIGSLQDITQPIQTEGMKIPQSANAETENNLFNDDIVTQKLQQEVDECAAELEKQSLELVESRQSLERKDNFIRIVSHELKTPITAMQGYVQLLVKSYKDHPDNFLTSSLGTVDRQMHNLTKLINDLLDVNSIESNSIELQMANFDICELVRETACFMQPTTTHKLVITGADHLQVNADKERINRVLVNLLTNAIKYSPQADKVLIHIRNDHSCAVVSVTDYGIGISAEFHNKIFDRFYRVQNTKERSFKGSGIGLYVAAEIIFKHQGKIWVESEKGKGATFCFSLMAV